MRKLISTGVALLSLLAGAAATGQTTQLKIATLAPENSHWMQQFRAGAREIRERTDDRVELKLYSGGVQGNEAKVLRKIQIGQLHGGTFSPTDFQRRYPDLNIYGLPFLFRNQDEVDYVRERLDPTLIEGFDDIGFVTFGFAGGGFAIIMSNAPVDSHEDLKGKKVWLPEGDLISYEAMRALDLSPVALPMTDVLTGLQTGLIDIVAIPPIVALALQWHTKVRYVTRVPVLYAMGFMAIQERAFERLAAEDRAVVRDVMTRIYDEVDAASRSDTENALDALLNVGLEEVELEAGEFEEMRAMMKGTNRRMAEEGMFSAELLDELQGHLEDYRSGDVAQDRSVARENGTEAATGSR